MASSPQLKAMVTRIDQIPKKLDAANKKSVAESSLLLKRAALAEIAKATGGDGALSGTKKSAAAKRRSIGPQLSQVAGRKISVRYRIRDGARGTSSLVSAQGPLQLVENDVKPHVVTSRYATGAAYQNGVTATGRARKGRSTIASRQASVLTGNGATGGGRRAVLHWGSNYARWTIASSKGRQPWGKAVKATEGQRSRRHIQNVKAAIK